MIKYVDIGEHTFGLVHRKTDPYVADMTKLAEERLHSLPLDQINRMADCLEPGALFADLVEAHGHDGIREALSQIISIQRSFYDVIDDFGIDQNEHEADLFLLSLHLCDENRAFKSLKGAKNALQTEQRKKQA